MRVLLSTIAIGSMLALAACGDEDSDEAQPQPTAEDVATTGDEAGAAPASSKGADADKPKPKPKPGTEITVSGSQFGDVIFDGNQQAIYLFDLETTSESECYGDCAAAWPPVLTDGRPVATGTAKQNLLGTTKRDDGTTQVTYAGQPLYYYHDEGPGEVRCHNVPGFGGLWLVLDANGDALL